MATTNCHQCRHHHPLVEIVSCKVRGCPMNYGVGCVVHNYPPYEEECRAIGTSTWKCPRCRGICGCTICTNFDDGKRRRYMNDEVILPIMSDSFVEAEALKQKVQELNATISNLETTISSLKASLANEEAQKLEAKEARKVIEKELHSVREVFKRVLASPKVKFTAEEPLRSIMGHKLRRIMDYKHNIRNITVIAQASQGKSSLTDALVAATAAAGIIAQDTAGDVRMTDTGISLYHHMTDEALKSFKGERNGNNYVINLIDSPAALCITDGALVVVDCIEGVCVQTETVLHQALVERVRPVLTVNNMDKCFLELQVDGERAYHIFNRVIKTVNVIMATYKDPLCGDVMVYPEKGTVAFSSGLHGWSFTLTNFAKMYAGKFGVDESKMMEMLWGDNFFDLKTKKWTKEDTGAATCKRGFVQFCYDPIKHIINTCMNDEQDILWPLLANLGVTMKSEEKELMGEPLMKRVMQNWLPAATALLEMVIFHLPSPHTAQRYRVENLYDGPLDDPYANAIKNCDRDGPVMLHVSKMIPAASGRFFAFGRVFAGTVSAGMKVRIRGPNFVPGEKKDLLYLYVKSVAIWMGKKQETVEDVPCGNTLSIMLSRIKEEEKSGGENLIAGLCLKDIEDDLMGFSEYFPETQVI